MRPHSAWYPWVQTSRRARVLSLCKGLSSGGPLSTRCSHLLSEKSDLESSPCHRPPGKEELRHQRGAWRAPPKPGSVSCELLRACRWPSAPGAEQQAWRGRASFISAVTVQRTGSHRTFLVKKSILLWKEGGTLKNHV